MYIRIPGTLINKLFTTHPPSLPCLNVFSDLKHNAEFCFVLFFFCRPQGVSLFYRLDSQQCVRLRHSQRPNHVGVSRFHVLQTENGKVKFILSPVYRSPYATSSPFLFWYLLSVIHREYRHKTCPSLSANRSALCRTSGRRLTNRNQMPTWKHQM